jgi:hypothetical protein
MLMFLNAPFLTLFLDLVVVAGTLLSLHVSFPTHATSQWLRALPLIDIFAIMHLSLLDLPSVCYEIPGLSPHILLSLS